MSALPQFLGMREAHDQHRALVERSGFGDRFDCDACLAIAMADEVMRALRKMLDEHAALGEHGGEVEYCDGEACADAIRLVVRGGPST